MAIRQTAWPALAALLLAGCAGPPLRLYTLGNTPESENARPLPRQAAVIEVDRLILPDYLDSEDILLRDGNLLERSSTGRWVTRLSALATDLVASRIATRASGALVTDQGHVQAPRYRIVIHVARLDIARDGRALMDADWQILTADHDRRSIDGRARIRLAGSTATDRDVVRLETAMFERLADSIRLPRS